MNLCLSGVLDADDLRWIRGALDGASFSDGRATAGWHARGVKQNLQTVHEEAARRVTERLQRHPQFISAALPFRMRAPIFSRYLPGMTYGTHVDDALMGGRGEPLRTDLAVTLFLNDPNSYDGGELVIKTHSGSERFKLPAGHAIVYPATSLHSVAEVTRGERLAAVLWVQSLLRDVGRREILFDLDTVRRSLWDRAGKVSTPDFDLLTKTYANLLRAWAET